MIALNQFRQFRQFRKNDSPFPDLPKRLEDYLSPDHRLILHCQAALQERRMALEKLEQVTGVKDLELVGRLADAGFNPDNISSIEMVPIAFVAWASEEVTPEENQAAVAAFYSMHLCCQIQAAGKVQSWLDNRPDDSLWYLWEDYTYYQLAKTTLLIRRAIGNQVLRDAIAIAQASGGVCGYGNICPAEREILNRIRPVFGI